MKHKELGGYAGEHFRENLRAIIYPCFRDGKAVALTVKRFFLTIFSVAVFLSAYLWIRIKKKQRV